MHDWQDLGKDYDGVSTACFLFPFAAHSLRHTNTDTDKTHTEAWTQLQHPSGQQACKQTQCNNQDFQFVLKNEICQDRAPGGRAGHWLGHKAAAVVEAP